MIKQVGCLIAVLSTLTACAQETSSYKPSAAIRQEARSDKPGANQYAAWDLSYIGEYQAALEVWDGSPRPVRPLSATDSTAFMALRPVNARAYILRRARTERIIILNEAHHNPRHRAFAASLLPELAKLGYQYFAAEGLNEQDTLLNRRAYPTLATGYYTKEPQFGQLLRTASRSGLKLVAYDYGFSREGEMDERTKARETAQARNIQQILQADPQAKIVVYCGFSHINEGPNGMVTAPAMAHHLSRLTGINPFTVDQTALTESGTRGGENAKYRLAQAPESAVFLTTENQPYAAADPNMSVDVNVFHPRTTYVQGRPGWIFTARRRPVPLKQQLTVGYPCLVFAYDAREDLTTVVPVDIVELQSATDQKAMALGKGRFTLVAKGPAGNAQMWSVKR
ncbi:hypothetical protein [Hymenobacter lapidiphilus]|uniref:Uncharacterized protein n=1 Tax=Hymenobacter lapidiphilus TaxID=2608003 RepID=A0A7Y7U7P1_9BACT|nr:hypothetical protein [Hymenobacter lapidiphilus]NVO32984.1 hypothetical protein [Hymenobacter lapidiphilus]